MKVEFYTTYGKLLARGEADGSNTIRKVYPVEGRGLSYGNHLQISVTEGKHAGSTITAQIMGDIGDVVTLENDFPFREKSA